MAQETRNNITLITDKGGITTVRNLVCHPKKKRNMVWNEMFRERSAE
jgi:hypothetical protein